MAKALLPKTSRKKAASILATYEGERRCAVWQPAVRQLRRTTFVIHSRGSRMRSQMSIHRTYTLGEAKTSIGFRSLPLARFFRFSCTIVQMEAIT